MGSCKQRRSNSSPTEPSPVFLSNSHGIGGPAVVAAFAAVGEADIADVVIVGAAADKLAVGVATAVEEVFSFVEFSAIFEGKSYQTHNKVP